MPIRIWCMKEHIPKESGKRWAGHGYLDHVPVGSLKKLSNQFRERGSVHGPLGYDALTPAKKY